MSPADLEDVVMNNVQSDAFDSAAHTRITATPVPENYRLAFLPRHFPRYFMQAESAVFGHMSNLCPRYTGGYGSVAVM